MSQEKIRKIIQELITRDYDNDDVGENYYHGDAGAGLLVYREDKKILLCLRSGEVKEPGTWSYPGGAVDLEEDTKEAAEREFREETQYGGEIYNTKLLERYVDEEKEFTYDTYIAKIESFKPRLNWENDKYGWFDLKVLPKPLHYGLKLILPKLRRELSGLMEEQIIKESAPDFDLANSDKAVEWAIENVDGFQEDMEVAEKRFGSKWDSLYVGRVYDYSQKYRETIKKPKITIYRGVKLDKEQELVLNPIGTYWSFDEEGVGAYGWGSGQWKMTKKDAPFYILTAEVEPKYIDWRHGFESFIWYGEDQWECSLDNGSPVLLTHINGKPLEKPRKAKA